MFAAVQFRLGASGSRRRAAQTRFPASFRGHSRHQATCSTNDDPRGRTRPHSGNGKVDDDNYSMFCTKTGLVSLRMGRVGADFQQSFTASPRPLCLVSPPRLFRRRFGHDDHTATEVFGPAEQELPDASPSEVAVPRDASAPACWGRMLFLNLPPTSAGRYGLPLRATATTRYCYDGGARFSGRLSCPHFLSP